MLHEFIAENREEIIRRCRAKVEARSMPPPTPAELEYGLPAFLDQLIEALRHQLGSNTKIDTSAARHGRELQLQGFTVSQVVHDYGDVCQSITDLALERTVAIEVDDFRTLNRCLDDAIACAVTEFGRQRDQSMLEAESAREDERIGFLTHEIRNLLSTAGAAFDILKSGNVGVGGSTGTVLKSSLLRLGHLVNRSLAEVRLRQGVHNRAPIAVRAFIEGLAPAAAMEATARDLQLIVHPGDVGAIVHADRQILSAVVVNLLQNAFKFTHPQTTVVLRVIATADRVLLEVEDECGGLPDGNVDELFRAFEQRHADRTGLGLGLAFSRWGTEVNDGRISAHNLPGRGCVFTIDLPRVPASVHALVGRSGFPVSSHMTVLAASDRTSG
jgi:signal transduction histidine kinase